MMPPCKCSLLWLGLLVIGSCSAALRGHGAAAAGSQTSGRSSHARGSDIASSGQLTHIEGGGGLEPLYDFLVRLRLLKLCKLLREAQLEDVLLDIGPFTLFAPPDNSFVFLPGGTLDQIQSDRQLLRDFLLHHFIQGEVTSQQFLDESIIPSVQGSPLRLNIYGAGQLMTVSGSQILQPDHQFELGVVHVIDRPLYPLTETDIVGYVQSYHNRLYRLLLSTNLIDLLSGGTYTLLVPDDKAFSFLTPDLEEAMAANISLAERIVMSHVLPGSIFVSGVTDGMQLETLGGLTLTFTVHRGLTFVNGVPIVQPDISVTNGVVHVINRVLLPEGVENDCHCRPSTAPGELTPSQRPGSGQRTPARPVSPTRVQPGPGTPPRAQPGSGTPSRVQPGPGTPSRVQPGPGTPSRVQPGPGTPSRVQPGPGTPSRVQPGPGTPFRVQPGPGTPSRVQPGPGTPSRVQPGPGPPSRVQPGPVQSPGTPPRSQPIQRPVIPSRIQPGVEEKPSQPLSPGQGQPPRTPGQKTRYPGQQPIRGAPTPSGHRPDESDGQFDGDHEDQGPRGQDGPLTGPDRAPFIPDHPDQPDAGYDTPGQPQGPDATPGRDTYRTHPSPSPRPGYPSQSVTPGYPSQGPRDRTPAPALPRQTPARRPPLTPAYPRYTPRQPVTQSPYGTQPPDIETDQLSTLPPPPVRVSQRKHPSSVPKPVVKETPTSSPHQRPTPSRATPRPIEQRLPPTRATPRPIEQRLPPTRATPRPIEQRPPPSRIPPPPPVQQRPPPASPPSTPGQKQPFQPDPQPQTCRQLGVRVTPSTARLPICPPDDVDQTSCQSPDQPYDPSDPRPPCDTDDVQLDCRNPDEPYDPADLRPPCPGISEPEGCRPILEPPYPNDRRPLCPNYPVQTGCRDPGQPYNPSDTRPLCPSPDTPQGCRQPEEPFDPSYPLPPCQNIDSPVGCRQRNERYNPQDTRPECPEEDGDQQECRLPHEPFRRGDQRPLCPRDREVILDNTPGQPQLSPESPPPLDPLAPIEVSPPGPGGRIPQSPPSGQQPGKRPQPPSPPTPQRGGLPDRDSHIQRDPPPSHGSHPGRPPWQQPPRAQRPGKQPQRTGSPISQDRPSAPSQGQTSPQGRPSSAAPAPHQPAQETYRRTYPGTSPASSLPTNQQRPGQPFIPSRHLPTSSGPQDPSEPDDEIPDSPDSYPDVDSPYSPQISGQSGSFRPQASPDSLPPAEAPRGQAPSHQPHRSPASPSQPGRPTRIPLPPPPTRRPLRTSAAPAIDQGSPGSAQKSLLQIIQNPGLEIKGHPVRLTIILDLFHKAGLDSILTGAGPTTVFLPSDDAFRSLPEGVLAQLERNPDLLQQVLLFHVVAQEVPPSDGQVSLSLPTLQGTPLVITVLNGGRLILIGGAKAVAVTRANNGIFYIINELLYPLPQGNIVEALRTHPDLSQVTSLLQRSGLDSTLRGEVPYTLFAPTDEAINRLPTAIAEEINSNVTALREILLGHLVEGAHFIREFQTGGVFPSARGGKLRFRLVSYGLTVNDVDLTTPEIVTGTGVIHIINTVLLAPEDLQTVDRTFLITDGGGGSVGGRGGSPGDGQIRGGHPGSAPVRGGTPGSGAIRGGSLGGAQGGGPIGGLPGSGPTRGGTHGGGPTGGSPGSGPIRGGTHGGGPTGGSPGSGPIRGGTHGGGPTGGSPGSGPIRGGTHGGGPTGGSPGSGPIRGGTHGGGPTGGSPGSGPIRGGTHGGGPIRGGTSGSGVIRGGGAISGGSLGTLEYPDVAELARGMGLNRFVTWIINTGLIEKVQDGGSYTVFAPTDDAINTLPPNVAGAIDSDPEQVRPLLKFHIIPEAVQLNAVNNEDTYQTLLQGKEIRFNVYQGGQIVTASGVPFGGSQNSGSVQLIPVDEVLYPPAGTLAKVLDSSPILQQLASAVRNAGLTHRFSDSGPQTVFAPSDVAFESLTSEEKNHLLTNQQAIKDLLNRHVVRGTLFSSGIRNGVQVKNEKGENIPLTVHGGGISVKGIPISYADVTATNGVLQVIDHFL